MKHTDLTPVLTMKQAVEQALHNALIALIPSAHTILLWLPVVAMPIIVFALFVVTLELSRTPITRLNMEKFKERRQRQRDSNALVWSEGHRAAINDLKALTPPEAKLTDAERAIIEANQQRWRDQNNIAKWLKHRDFAGDVKAMAEDKSGAFAVEFAILLPIGIWLLGGSVSIWQGAMLQSACAFTAQSAAAVGGRSVSQGFSAAQQAAQSNFTANQATAFSFGAQGTLAGVTPVNDAQGNLTAVTVNVTGQTEPFFNVLMPGQLNCSATVTD